MEEVSLLRTKAKQDYVSELLERSEVAPPPPPPDLHAPDERDAKEEGADPGQGEKMVWLGFLGGFFQWCNPLPPRPPTTGETLLDETMQMMEADKGREREDGYPHWGDLLNDLAAPESHCACSPAAHRACFELPKALPHSAIASSAWLRRSVEIPSERPRGDLLRDHRTFIVCTVRAHSNLRASPRCQPLRAHLRLFCGT
ncbi:hypothetical protein B0H16DRAFT_1728397 [Mycena metata]|uniref:Uncharacterized protein n=1 Tax=Mycena metata TaxID=1033252 RepID=A0AAD7IFG9_9AGAR|nr:hypothetical protein B0H16DRAFT_1728397 [Mycena metata]